MSLRSFLRLIRSNRIASGNFATTKMQQQQNTKLPQFRKTNELQKENHKQICHKPENWWFLSKDLVSRNRDVPKCIESKNKI